MKLACCFCPPRVDAEEVVGCMAESQRLCGSQSCQVYPVPRGALACVKTSECHSKVSLRREHDNGNLLLISGVPLDLGGSLETRLEKVLQEDLSGAAQELTSLDGAFAALFWHAASQRLLVVTDPLGLQPLYVTQSGGCLLLASELKAFPASGLVDVEMDLAGWGAFVGFGFAIGERTQLAGVRRVGPALKMVYDSKTGAMESETYWHWPELQPEMTLETVDTGRLVDALRQELTAYAQHDVGGTMLLSAGFDSRLTLALLTEGGWNPNALVLAHQDVMGGWEGKLGVQLARRLDVPVQLAKPARSYYSSAEYLDYLVMNEVATPSLYLFIAQVSAQLRENMGLVWDGTPPGYALVPAFLPTGGFDVIRRETQAPMDSYVWGTVSQTFGPSRAEEMYQAADELFRGEAAKYPDDEYGVLQYEVMNRMRNRTSPNCLKVYANFGMPCMLGISRPFWDYAGAIPYSASRNYQLYRRIFMRHFPRIADIPVLSGGQCWSDHPSALQRRLATTRHTLANSRAVYLMRKAHRRWIMGSRRYWTRSKWLAAVRERMELEHPDLDPDGVRALGIDVRMPFYWQTWRWIMSGELTTWNREKFFEQQSEKVI